MGVLENKLREANEGLEGGITRVGKLVEEVTKVVTRREETL